MNTQNLLIGVLLDEKNTISITEVCHRFNIPKELIIEMIEYGIFPNQPSDINNITLDNKALQRMESAFRLHRDLEINLAGVALVLELLEKMDHMHHELEILRRHHLISF